MKYVIKIFILIFILSPLYINFQMESEYFNFKVKESIVYAGGKGGVIENNDNEQNENQSGNTAGQKIQLENPLGDVKDIPTLVKKLLEIVLKIGVPLIALSIIYTGYLFIAAQGNPEKLKQAKDTFVYVLIGAAILLGAYVIANAVYNTIQAIRGV